MQEPIVAIETRYASMLYMLCGKIGAGKTTLAKQLESDRGCIRISEDDWLSELYPGSINTLDDYITCVRRFRSAISEHLTSLLSRNISVVLDMAANTAEVRAWGLKIATDAQADHFCFWLDANDDVCKRRIALRNASGEHPYQISDDVFDLFSSRFIAPSTDEGLNIIRLIQ